MHDLAVSPCELALPLSLDPVNSDCSAMPNILAAAAVDRPHRLLLAFQRVARPLPSLSFPFSLLARQHAARDTFSGGEVISGSVLTAGLEPPPGLVHYVPVPL